MTTALVVRPELTPDRWALISAIAPSAHQARLFRGVSSPATAAMIMLKGQELGLSLTASFEFIQMIEGQPPAVSPRGALALIHKSPECAGLRVTRLTDDKGAFVGYEVWMKRRTGFEHTERWTLEDAKRAGLVKAKGAWETYPENMCKWRAIGFCADVVFPDVLGGLKTADQYGAAVDPAGDVVAGHWSDADDATADGAGVLPGEPDETTDVAAAAQALLAEYGPERVLAANGNAIPTTLEEIDALRDRLIAETAEEE